MIEMRSVAVLKYLTANCTFSFLRGKHGIVFFARDSIPVLKSAIAFREVALFSMLLIVPANLVGVDRAPRSSISALALLSANWRTVLGLKCTERDEFGLTNCAKFMSPNSHTRIPFSAIMESRFTRFAAEHLACMAWLKDCPASRARIRH